MFGTLVFYSIGFLTLQLLDLNGLLGGTFSVMQSKEFEAETLFKL